MDPSTSWQARIIKAYSKVCSAFLRAWDPDQSRQAAGVVVTKHRFIFCCGRTQYKETQKQQILVPPTVILK